MKQLPAIAICCLFLLACSESPTGDIDRAREPDPLIEDYLLLELSLGWHDSNHVDAYFGPESIKETAERMALSLDQIDERADDLIASLQVRQQNARDPAVSMRMGALIHRLQALHTRVAINQGRSLPFDEETRRLFGVRAPDYDAGHFDDILGKIDAVLPGDNELSMRINEFREQFIIPPERLPDVFDAAIAECRRRTLEHIDLPENESFRVEYVNDKPWSGYNWYQGDAHSLIQINTDLPIYISRAVDLGCHEGYPGHHTFNLLLEDKLVKGRGWLEYTLYPLFSPQSTIAEGTGEYGKALAFPGTERLDFEKQVLFPLAGLDRSKADQYYRLEHLREQLRYAENEAARDYLNGDISRDEAAQWLVNYALLSPERAQQRMDFIEMYRSYVINYNLGEDLIRSYVERDEAGPAERWQRFETILSSPIQASDLLD